MSLDTKVEYPKISGKVENQYFHVTAEHCVGNSSKRLIHTSIVGPFDGAWKKCKKQVEQAVAQKLSKLSNVQKVIVRKQ